MTFFPIIWALIFSFSLSFAYCQLSIPYVSKIDTTGLKKIVTDLTSEREHIEFWKNIHHRDQDLMKLTRKEGIDQEDLILVSYYLNFFGYPDRNRFGNESQIINYVYIHTTSYEVKKLTFPILLQGLLSNNISEKDFREYFIQGSYHRCFDDNGNMTKPLGVIFKELNLNVSDKISIPDLVRELETFNSFISQEVDTIGHWQMRSRTDTFSIDGKQIVKIHKGAEVMIFHLANERIYIKHVFSREPFDPIELVVLDEKSKTYRDKYRVTTDFYRITKFGDLEYVDDAGNRIVEYLKI